MKNRILLLLIITAFLQASVSRAQTPSDALMMKKNELCLAVFYQYDTWDKYWEGTLLRDNQNIGVLTRNTYMPMLAYGIHKKLNLMVSLPYITTHASGGQMKGVSGMQDAGIFAKYQLLDLQQASRSFQAFITGGFSLPASSYLSDYMPFSLGLGAKEFSLRGIAKYEYKSGFYLRASYAYLSRTTTEAERNYYYADKGIYTTTMDVPNATNAELCIGGWLLNRSVQLEISGINQKSLSGDDIRRQNQPQPTNKMNFTNANIRWRYFPVFFKGFSVIGAYTQVFEGRNIGKSSIISGGITYQFSVKKQGQDQ